MCQDKGIVAYISNVVLNICLKIVQYRSYHNAFLNCCLLCISNMVLNVNLIVALHSALCDCILFSNGINNVQY